LSSGVLTDSDLRILASHVVPARSGLAVRVRAGQTVRVTDPRGSQVADLFAFADTGSRRLTTHLSAGHTRGHTSRLFPAVGQDFVTDTRQPVLRLTGDASPGRHDMLIPACDAERYRLLGATGHRSCVANVHEALAALELTVDTVPQPVNLFMDIPVGQEGALDWLPAPSRPGDAVSLSSHLDVVVVVSACPQDLVGINGGEPTELRLDLLQPA
jgi:uncharacterized protein YcgI (DUF1989 family)